MTTKEKRIGILGGTFNPPHHGHFRIAQKAKEVFGLSEVVCIPTGLPPHKGIDELQSREHRYNMVKIAIEGLKDFSLSDIELRRPGFSYAIDTFNDLRKLLGKKAKLFYIMGVDSLNDILSWKKPLELLKMCEVIVATRPKTSIRTFKRLIKFPPLMTFSDKIHLIEVDVDIASSEIRRRIRAGLPVRKFLNLKVLNYIKKQGLYKTDESTE